MTQTHPKQLVFRCSSGLSTLDVALQTTNFSRLGVIEAPQLGGAIPPDLGLITYQHNVYHMIVLGHTVLPDQTGCQSLDAYRSLLSRKAVAGLPATTAEWLHLHLHSPKPYFQVRALGEQLTGEHALAAHAVGITAVIMDHMRQMMLPVGWRPPLGEWEWVPAHEWNQSVEDDFATKLPYISLSRIHEDFRDIIEHNWSVSPRASKMARLSGYHQGQQFKEVVINTTAYPPTAYADVRRDMQMLNTRPRPDAYVNIYVSVFDIPAGIAQLDWALSQATEHTTLRVIMPRGEDQVALTRALGKSLIVKRWSERYDKLPEMYVLEPPY